MSDQTTPRMRRLQELARDGSEGAAVLWLLLHDKPTAEQDQVLDDFGRKVGALVESFHDVVAMLRRFGLLPDPGDEPF